MSDDESKQKVAGRAPAGMYFRGKLPFLVRQIQLIIISLSFLLLTDCNDVVAVKAGGMRIVQHKTTHNERAPHSEPVEIIGLNQNNPLVDSAVVSTTPNHSSTEQHHAAHGFKPAAVVPQKPQNVIQQPRK